MKFFSFREKSQFLCVFLILLCSCNYKPLFDKDQLSQLSFKNVKISGNKRIAQILVNKLNIIRDQTGNLILSVDAEKNVNVSNRSADAKVLEYSVALTYQIEIKNNLNENIVYSKSIKNTQNYKPSKTYSDTISEEKKIIENISSLIAKQILNEINLALRNDI